MPKNKKHHYVPRFYLKRFSPENKNINLFNIISEKVITNANLKNQCYRDYFYGKELDIENALSIIEGKASDIFLKIDDNISPPSYTSSSYLDLIFYTLIQYGRTTYSADTLNELNEKLIKHILKEKAKEDNIDLDEIKIGLVEPARFSLGIIASSYPLILDLSCKLLINETNVDFITSDNPVVMYNQLLSFRKVGSNTGLVSKGLQIFFPISSHLLLLFYDHNAYSVGKKNSQTVQIILPKDVYELNTLQMASAYENIYFQNENFNILALFKKAKKYRRTTKTHVSVHQKEKSSTGRREIIASSREDVMTNLSLSFIHLTKSTKTWLSSFKKLRYQPVSVIRNEQLVCDFEEFREKIKEGDYEYDEFHVFCKSKYQCG